MEMMPFGPKRYPMPSESGGGDPVVIRRMFSFEKGYFDNPVDMRRAKAHSAASALRAHVDSLNGKMPERLKKGLLFVCTALRNCGSEGKLDGFLVPIVKEDLNTHVRSYLERELGLEVVLENIGGNLQEFPLGSKLMAIVGLLSTYLEPLERGCGAKKTKFLKFVYSKSIDGNFTEIWVRGTRLCPIPSEIKAAAEAAITLAGGELKSNGEYFFLSLPNP